MTANNTVPWRNVAISFIVVYGLIAIVTWVFFALVLRSVHKRWQQAFYFFIGIGCTVRTVYWGLHYALTENGLRISQPLFFFLNTIPTDLVFTSYLVLLLLWVEVLKEVPPNAKHMSRYRIVFFVIIVLLYVTAFFFYFWDFGAYHKTVFGLQNAHTWPEAIILAHGVAWYIFVSVSFLVYGILLCKRLRRATGDRSLRAKLLTKVGVIAGAVTLCFLVRAAFIINNAVGNVTPGEWWLDIVYYVVTEIVPLLLLLGVLRNTGRDLAATKAQGRSAGQVSGLKKTGSELARMGRDSPSDPLHEAAPLLRPATLSEGEESFVGVANSMRSAPPTAVPSSGGESVLRIPLGKSASDDVKAGSVNADGTAAAAPSVVARNPEIRVSRTVDEGAQARRGSGSGSISGKKGSSARRSLDPALRDAEDADDTPLPRPPSIW